MDDLHRFHPDHLADLRKSGLSDEMIAAAGVRSISARGIVNALGFPVYGGTSLLCFPYPGADGFCRYKAFYESDFAGKRPKYLQKKGSGSHLYIPDTTRTVLRDTSVPLYLTEGEKKTLKGCQEGLFCIGLSGLWNWSDGDKGLIADFSQINIEGRTVCIVPDNDYRKSDAPYGTKNLEKAVSALAQKLMERGAQVSVVGLPDGPEKGLDDYLCNHTVEDLRVLPAEKVEGTRRGGGGKNQAKKLIDIGSKLPLFHDEMREGYAELKGGNAKIRSSSFKQYLAKMLWEQEAKAANSDSLNQALNVLEAKALFDSPRRVLFNRVAEHEGGILYHLGDDRAVRIGMGGWETIDHPPAIFRSYPHQQVQVEPARGGDLRSLFKYLNITDPDHRLLAEVLLVSYYITNIGRPILVAWGDQGSGKTTICVIFKALIDPSKLSVLFAPRDLGETVQALDHHCFLAFDNISSMPDWLSDLLSQAVTGAGLSKRKLYTDDEDHIFQLKRGIAVNGINQLIHRPDAMDRSILLRHSRLSPSQRRSERELFADFEHDRPYLLGAVFDALSKAMEIYPTIHLSALPRMADFALWGCAIAQALGYTQDDFLGAYHNNIRTQNSEVLGANTLAQTVLLFMTDKTEWTGTVKEAFELLHSTAQPRDKDPTFPKSPNRLRHHLERIKPNLLDFGVAFTLSEPTKEGTFITFQKVADVSSVSSPSSQTREESGFCGEDRSKVSSPVSSREKANYSKPREDGEAGEDKNGTFWRREKEETGPQDGSSNNTYEFDVEEEKWA
jgi:hypothetical protein